MSMKQHISNLLGLLSLTTKEDFVRSPQGYAKRERTCLLQLCLHSNPVVRRAAAELELMRDMFIIAMYGLEEDSNIKEILRPKYEAACSESQRYENKVAVQATEITGQAIEIRKLKLQLSKARK